MYDFIYEFILSTKYLSIFLLMFLLPSETVMPVVGYMASQGYVMVTVALAAGVLGTTLWAMGIYALARRGDQAAVYRFVDKQGRWAGVSRKSVERAGRWFDRHARTTVFVGRFIPGVRTAVSIPAGFRRMPFGTFVAYTALGSGIDSALLAYAGYTARARFAEIQILIDDLAGLIVLSLVLLAFAWLVWRRYKKSS